MLLQVSQEMNDDPENHNEYRVWGRLAGRAVAQSYSASYGTGNVIDVPLLEKTNGRYGYGGIVAPRPGDPPSAYAVQGRSGISAYAYSPTAPG